MYGTYVVMQHESFPVLFYCLHLVLFLYIQVYETHARLSLEAGDLPEYNQVGEVINMAING